VKQDKELYSVPSSSSIKNAVKKMDVDNINSLIVLDEDNKVIGVFTMGDFRRAVLNGLDINNNLSLIVNRDYVFLQENYSENDVRDTLARKDTDLVMDIPVLNNEKHLVDIISRKKLLKEGVLDNNKLKEIPVVIMAGGKGTRMDPFTRILPKPLIPLGNDPIIKVIMDEFIKFGMNDFYISINDKGQMIKAYFHDHELPYSIQFIEEDKPLGTAGALLYMEDKFSETFFVTNCDIIIHADYNSIMEFHKKGKYDLTLVASMRHYLIPYGVCDVDNGGELKGIKEKPEYDLLVNTGLYVLEPEVLKLIPKNICFDMTDLINKIQGNGMKVGVFPVSEKSWADIGQWTEYNKTITELKSTTD
jgi:dTDP-glucose pyrophosphorylase/CBS domain-containing protein